VKGATGAAIASGAAIAAVALVCVCAAEWRFRSQASTQISSPQISSPQASNLPSASFASRFPSRDELGTSRLIEVDPRLERAKADLAKALTAQFEPKLPMPDPRDAVAEASEKVPLPRMRPSAASLMASLEPVPQQAPIAQPAARQTDPLSGVGGAFRKVFAMLQPSDADPAGMSGETRSDVARQLPVQTALYDISARTVYMPDGSRLEAHSGLGDLMDDPGNVHVKDRGATPPQVYELSMREKSFHGVEALRMKPVGEGSLYGRDGFLAHSYMMGPKGDSNGCVSFKDYAAFLKAYKDGNVRKLIVVPSLAGTTVASAART